MRTKPTFVLSSVLAATMLLAACGEAERAEQKATDEYPAVIEQSDDYDSEAHLSVGVTNAPPSWDPTESITNGDFTPYVPIYDRLLQTGDNGDPEPMLAESFEPADDDSAMILKLREGLKFSDGEPFNAEAVKFNLERAAGPDSKINGELNMITSVEVVDEYTAKVNVSKGLGTLAVSLTSRGGIMVSPKAAKAGTLTDKPAGIGPYTSTAISPGSSMEMERTPDYWEPEAQRVATMTYSLITEDQARYNALVSGEIDVAQINANQMDDVLNAGANVVANETPLFLYFGINTSVKPFDNPEARKALNLAIDRQAIADGLYDGHCTPSIQYVPSTSPGYSDKVGDGSDIFPYDPEEAKKILEDLGATDIEITSVPPNVTIYTKFAEVLQDQLADVGISLEVKPLPPAQLVQEFSIDKSAEAMASIATVINDPEAVHGRYLTPDALFNPGGTDYSELNAAAEAAAIPLDPAERKPLYEKYWDIWVENPTHVVPVCMVHLAGAANKNVSGVQELPTGSLDLRYASIAKE
ncbi:ABC transporter substrate-binding protein [Cumulibacter soli]|uniref:ABC transporter substrate-binding protein n=1 Tax=Cumulibacter soli TaxID=2546344 RepID=UPI0010684919|nr:ABC transporter substrate-binding protein [Cumulibacter soli]